MEFRIMAELTRKEARETAFCLLFETEFHGEDDPCAVYETAVENREIADDEYVRGIYFGGREHLEQIDALMEKYSNGWKVGRISPVSRSVIRLCIYEMLYREDIPSAVSLNEAVELVKKYDDQKMRAFVNGLLNGVKNELEAAK